MKTPIVLFLMFFLFPLAINAQDIYVDAANTSGIEDGSQEHPFSTIKEAIAHADEGTTVYVLAGTYYPDSTWSQNTNVLHLKPGIKIKGEGSGSTIVEGIIVDQNTDARPIALEDISFDEFYFYRGAVDGPYTDKNIIRNCSTGLLNFCFAGTTPVNDTTPSPNNAFLIEGNDLGSDGEISFNQGFGASDIQVLNNTSGWISINSAGIYNYLIDNNVVSYGIIDRSGPNYTIISHNTILNGGIMDMSCGLNTMEENEIIKNNLININEDSPFLELTESPAAIKLSCLSVSIKSNTVNCSGNISGIIAASGGPFHVLNNTITLTANYDEPENPDEAICGLKNFSGWGYVNGNTISGGQIAYYSIAGTVKFTDNTINNAYWGFYSIGAEAVYNNHFTDCTSHGMILAGLRGPVFRNTVENNGGHGIMVLMPDIDLGGGKDNCQGNNVIRGNAAYDLYLAAGNTQYPVFYARYNVWDHGSTDEIIQYDIWDANDSISLPAVDISPTGSLGITEANTGDKSLFYPNPASGIVNCDLPQILNAMALQADDTYLRIEVFDQKGRNQGAIYEAEGTSQTIAMDVSHLPPGVYLFRIAMGDILATEKIIIY